MSDLRTPLSNPDRFLGRAGAYAAARPGYPPELGTWLRNDGLLGAGVADIGAGTGLFTRLLLHEGATVTAVEPNPEMRTHLAAAFPDEQAAGRLTVQAGTSEATGLPGASVNLITAAQAAHWFDPPRTVLEFRRVLRPGGQVLLVWNDWRGADTPFNRVYGEVVRAFTEQDAPPLATRVPEDQLPGLLPGGFQTRLFEQRNALSRERLHALAGSVSYLPAPDAPAFPALQAELDLAFDHHAERGKVTLTYVTHAFLGRLD
ncbi:class I SAM-dependent methyltransferase [Deinococcus taeanensis]|uniref:class I SAM-dependent methyltransferase n=1 Tax=Deinococcus taeanensis TaxID=2737050 RepID=UPI001CDD53F8|nr:class I SAM-dependent methyltransferase [Deinococcus taeanensis]UBV43843.1 class I SAM-dependent methyltransferase [Deinococcus taeanensis]